MTAPPTGARGKRFHILAREDRIVSDRRSALARQFPAMWHHDYRALWIAAGMSSATLWAMLMARAWIALELTDSGFVVGAVTFAGMIPWLIAPIGGALAALDDRVFPVDLRRRAWTLDPAAVAEA